MAAVTEAVEVCSSLAGSPSCVAAVSVVATVSDVVVVADCVPESDPVSATAMVVDVARSASRTGTTARASTADATLPEIGRSMSSVATPVVSVLDVGPLGVNAASPTVAMSATIRKPARTSGMRDRTGLMLYLPIRFGNAVTRSSAPPAGTATALTVF